MADLAFRVQAVIKTEVDVTEAQLSRNGIDVVHGIAHFVDPRHVRVEGSAGRYHAEVGARSSSPWEPSPPPRPRCPSTAAPSSTATRFSICPRCRASMIVVGGGVIGVEYACMFAILGVRVTHDRKAGQAAGVCRPGDHRGAQLSSARQPRDHAAGRRSGERGGAARRNGGGESRKQEANLRRRAAVRGGPAGSRRGPEPGGGGHRGRQPRAHPGGRELSHQGRAHLRGGRRGGVPGAGVGLDGAGAHRGAPRLRRQRRPRRIPASIPTAFTPFPRSASSARPKSN